MSKTKAVVLLSGGMDSVAALYYAIHNGYDVLPISFAYGSKHNVKERAAAMKICEKEAIDFFTFDLPTEGLMIPWSEFGPAHNFNLLKSDLLNSGGEIPEGHYEEDSMKATVVPFRNGIMLSLAVGFAESYGADVIFLGNHAGDHAVYPDCRAEFIGPFSQATQAGTYNGVQIISPFVTWSKTDIAAWGMENGVPYASTWTCYKGEDRPCLKCGTCTERVQAFLESGHQDPLLTQTEWDEGVAIWKQTEADFNAKS